ncbi:MAG: VCBS repeat-containing protein, partial [Chloroflexota bacterium]
TTVLADWDGDGDLDAASDGKVYRYEDDQFLHEWTAEIVNDVRSMAWGDWDNDSDLDLMIGTDVGEPNYLYENDNGTFTLVWSSNDTNTKAEGLAWGDWDGDGDLDLAIANNDLGNQIYENHSNTLNLAWTEDKFGETSSIAWGDWDNDGDLDLAMGHSSTEPIRLYETNNDDLSLIWSSEETDNVSSIAWGDYDGDGDLDLAVGSTNQPVRLYRNTGTESVLQLAWSSDEIDNTISIAWGDYDHDGDLDLAVSNLGSPSLIYENKSQNLVTIHPLKASAWTQSAEWGDYDGDGDLDLLMGNRKTLEWGPISNWVYTNEDGQLSLTWESPEKDETSSVAWGDWDNDGDLDIAVGNEEQPNRVYANEAGDFTLVWSSPDSEYTKSIAWGDWDGDGDLDLAVANLDQANQIYENIGNDLVLAWTSQETESTWTVAWGDWDGDSDLDLAVGNHYNGDKSHVYENTGGDLHIAWSTPQYEFANSVAWGDWDNDGDLDLAIGRSSRSDNVYENINGNLVLAWSSDEANTTHSVSWEDWDHDGDLDLSVGTSKENYIYQNINNNLVLYQTFVDYDDIRSIRWADWDDDGDLDLLMGDRFDPNFMYVNRAADIPPYPNVPVRAKLLTPQPSTPSGFSSAQILSGPTLPIRYRIIGPEGTEASHIKAYYSLDGGRRWLDAIATSETITTNLAASPEGTEHTFIWDVYGSNVFGSSDQAVLRLDVYTSPLRNPGPYLYTNTSAKTLPFRLRGSQVRVVNSEGVLTDAVVYRLPIDGNDTTVFAPYRDSFEKPFTTNTAGYLKGSGELLVGDQLVAMYPISATTTLSPTGGTAGYSIYHTSAAPNETGIEAYEVIAAGTQTLTVATDNPLILFDLDVALEWDSSNDTTYLRELQLNLKNTSKFLYDWTDGQAALGKLKIYNDAHNAPDIGSWQPWRDADIRVYASNRVRPRAAQGGFVHQTVTDPVSTDDAPVIYLPGQVHMGQTWRRDSDSGENSGDDWSKALAHELSHYLFYLDDNYVGYNENGLIIPVDTCQGAMADPYLESEYHPVSGWVDNCQKTLSHEITGRSDWETIELFYPSLQAPTGEFNSHPGPSRLPLFVTEIDFITVTSALTGMPILTKPIDTPLFQIQQNEQQVRTSDRSRAILFQEDWIVDLGKPIEGQISADGARIGDRLCIYDIGFNRLGCETIRSDDSQITLVEFPTWQPQIVITPISSDTVQINVTNVPNGLALNARFFSLNHPSNNTVILDGIDNGYQGVLQMNEPVIEGYIHVWVDEPEPRREVIADYSLAGSLIRIWTRLAPVVSSDGQVTLFSKRLNFELGEFFTLQTATIMPGIPSWASLVGQGYWVTASPDAIDKLKPQEDDSNISITFQYLQSEVVPGEESGLDIYYLDNDTIMCGSQPAPCWRQLDTVRDTVNNFASAGTQGPGLYALMSSIKISLNSGNWEDFSSPLNSTKPITDVLAQIKDQYSVICHKDRDDEQNPWKCHGADAPTWANDLNEIGDDVYWIYLKQETINTTLRFTNGGNDNLVFSSSAQNWHDTRVANTPPAVFYGEVLSSTTFIPEVGMTVTAHIGNDECGRSTIQEIEKRYVYVIDVSAEDGSKCDSDDAYITFQIEDDVDNTTFSALWDDRCMHAYPLDFSEPETSVLAGSCYVYQIYLPTISR